MSLYFNEYSQRTYRRSGIPCVREVSHDQAERSLPSRRNISFQVRSCKINATMLGEAATEACCNSVLVLRAVRADHVRNAM